MENITIGQIVAAIGTISVIAAFFVAIFKWYKSSITDRFAKIEGEIKELKSIQKKQDVEIRDSKEERMILLKGQLACLQGLKQGGANGPVTKAIEEINSYLMSKSHD